MIRSRPHKAIEEYNPAKGNAVAALATMTSAMKRMGAEHIDFHDHFADVQETLQDMKKAYGDSDLDVEVIRSTALDRYISRDNLPKLTALGHYEVEKALKDFHLQEKELDGIRKKTAMLVESLLGNRHGACDDGHGALA